MLKYLPFIVVGLVLIPLTYVQWRMMDWVWTSNVPAQQCAYLLQTEIPQEIGDWVGTDNPVDPEVRKTAGADGYISRTYVNKNSPDQRVTVWLIVGHFRNVSRHTPNICYRGAGYEQVERASVQPFVVEGIPKSKFRTAKFKGATKQGQPVYERVFWAWWKPEPLGDGQTVEDVNIAWTSPEDPRLEYGFCRALYKLYFTAVSTEEEAPIDSVCHEFAEVFLPVVHERLRESGMVMRNDDLPDNYEEVLQQMEQANEQGKSEDAEPAEATESSSEEETAEAS